MDSWVSAGNQNPCRTAAAGGFGRFAQQVAIFQQGFEMGAHGIFMQAGSGGNR